MKKVISLVLILVLMISVTSISLFNVSAIESNVYRDSEFASAVFVDVSAVAKGDESFWAYIWYGGSMGEWVPMEISDTGRYVISMSSGEYAVFTRMESGKEPDWNYVFSQTDDIHYTGEYNCAVLNYLGYNDRMGVEWMDIDAVDKSALVKAMREAEKYLFYEADKYTTESIADLQYAFRKAQENYEISKEQVEIDSATSKLRVAINRLVLKDAPPVNKNMLSQAISTAISYYMSLDTFTTSSWNRMINKCYAAREVERDENATQAQVDLATEELLDAINRLERVEGLTGDVDGDGKVNVLDATLIQCHVARIYTIEPKRYRYADTYKDGAVTILDATIIQRFLAQLIPEL